jgi:UDP-N-acetylglucosamine--N-acetylmuramyl-(pentapeptide) pyrophosphoryl-undecaprenol N-acetylglucosamine transferase
VVNGRPLTIVFAGGGTGGHLYPGLAVAETLARRRPQARIEWVGAERGLEKRVVPQAGYPLFALRLHGLAGAGLVARVRGVLAAAVAVVRLVRWMRERRPQLAVGVGGYASGPAMLAALVLRVPTLVQEQNHWPGATNRFLSRHVDAVCVPSEAARTSLGGRGHVTGNPVREAFGRAGELPQGERLSLLVFGGSRGARSINRAATAALEQLAALTPPPRIVHQTGADDIDRVRDAYARHYPPNLATVEPFFDDMPERMAAASLVVCRSGASTLSELCAAGRPAILVPYPHAAGDHQRRNAEVLAAAGAAEIIADAELDGTRLFELIRALAADRPRLEAMAEAARALGRLDAAERIADVAEALLERRKVA